MANSKSKQKRAKIRRKQKWLARKERIKERIAVLKKSKR